MICLTYNIDFCCANFPCFSHQVDWWEWCVAIFNKDRSLKDSFHGIALGQIHPFLEATCLNVDPEFLPDVKGGVSVSGTQD